MDRTYKPDILPPAQAELEKIARIHLALSGPKSACDITDKIYAAMDQLTMFPLSGLQYAMNSSAPPGIAAFRLANI